MIFSNGGGLLFCQIQIYPPPFFSFNPALVTHSLRTRFIKLYRDAATNTNKRVSCLRVWCVQFNAISVLMIRQNEETNPHLLRDMIVTHIRKNADASEKELEALALFMGHSVSMQRESYDRRTLEQKIEPAIQMMQQMMMTDVRQFGKKSQ